MEQSQPNSLSNTLPRSSVVGNERNPRLAAALLLLISEELTAVEPSNPLTPQALLDVMKQEPHPIPQLAQQIEQVLIQEEIPLDRVPKTK